MTMKPKCVATEIAQDANLEISEGDVACLKILLAQAIQAKVELDTLEENMRQMAADAGISIKTLIALRPRANDLDLYKVAEMLQILDLLQPITAGSVEVEVHA